MNLIARARRYLSTSRRSARRLDDDPADMGTAFGLDAITTIQPETPAEIAARENAAPASRIELPAAPPLDLLGRAAPRRSLRRHRAVRRALTPRSPAAADAPRLRRAAHGRANCRRPASARRARSTA